MGVAVAMESIVRVQTLSEASLGEVPKQYIQPLEKRPIAIGKQDADFDNGNIPLIDLSGMELEQRDSVREMIGEACKEWGAFQVINHGVPLQLLDGMRSAGLTFFREYPMEQKLKYACPPNTAATEGYGSKMLVANDNDKDKDAADVMDWRDYFDHHTFPLSRRNPSHWPDFPSNYREVVEEYSNQMKALAHKLLRLISESLGLGSSRIEDVVGDFYQNITVSYYPPCAQPDLTLGLQSHSDMGCMTLLIQDDAAGLQVLKDSEWIDVRPLACGIVVLIADQTEIITNGKYRSATHRAVTNSGRARLSVATFHDPAKTIKVAPALELISDSSPPRYQGVVYGDYVSSWYTKGPGGKRNIDALVIN